MGLKSQSYITGILITVLMLPCFSSCRDDPENPVAVDEDYAIAIQKPQAGSVFLAAAGMEVQWSAVEGYKSPVVLVIEFREMDTASTWQTLATVPFDDGKKELSLPAQFPERFILRLRGLDDECRADVSPLFAANMAVSLSEPAAEQRFLDGATVHIGWTLHFPEQTDPIAFDTGSVLLEYASPAESQTWHNIGEYPATQRAVEWELPNEVQSTFALRMTSSHLAGYETVSPLYRDLLELSLLTPENGKTYDLDEPVRIRWDANPDLGPGDSLSVHSRFLAGGWQSVAIGKFPYSMGGTEWYLPDDIPRKYEIVIRHEDSGSEAEARFDVGRIRLLNFPPATGLRRGSVIDLEVAFEWSVKLVTPQYQYALSVDGGATWPYSGGIENILVDFPVSDRCVVRVTDDRSPLEDTSAVFSIVEDLTPASLLQVGRQYDYACGVVEWRVIAGGTYRQYRDKPDISMIVDRREIEGDRAVYYTRYWLEGASDTATTIIDETLSGLHPMRSREPLGEPSLPFDGAGIIASFDSQVDSLAYRSDDNRIVVSRQRGLVSMVYFLGGYPMTDEYRFELK